MRELEPNSPLNDPVGVKGDPIAVDIQSIDSSAQRATDGKEAICPFYSSTIIIN